jgi:hypothetical protein
MVQTDRAKSRRWKKLYGDVGAPLATCFVPRGRTEYVIYAVNVRDHAGITKVGRTTKWANRRVAYANWNLALGDAITGERVFRLTDEFVDLVALEAHILNSLPFARFRGNEWFVGELDDVAREIDQILCASDLSYI